jgi:pimeloyl-ACP methyl ester carboxylesterase
LRAIKTQPIYGGYAGVKSILCIFALLFSTLLLTGCFHKPLVPFSLEIPPLILAPVSSVDERDGRGRFREIYCAVQKDHGAALPYDQPCDEVVVQLAGEPGKTDFPVWLGRARTPLRVLVVPGLFCECVGRITTPYSYALQHLERLGFKVGTIPVSGRSSSAHNALQIRDAVIKLDLQGDEKVVLVGYSKGVPDVLEALVNYPEIRDRVTAVVSIAGAVGGSPIADSLEGPFLELINKIPALECPPGDGGAIESLKQSTRQQWLSRHQLPLSIRYFSIVGFAERERISVILRGGYDKLAFVDPRNDGQLVFWNAVIPGGMLLGYVRADHWAIAMPFSQDLPALSTTFINHNDFPREILLEAIIRFVEENLLNSQ